MYYLPSSCLVFFFIFSLFHHLPCSSYNLESCDETLFQCGNITAAFPFWGGNRYKYCGHPLLGLRCSMNTTTSIFISGHEFNVLQINQTSNTLRLARTDHLGLFCFSTFANTTLSPEIFKLSSNSKSLTVFHHCNSFPPYPWTHTFPHCICRGKGLISASEKPEHNTTCSESFTVNLPRSFVPEEKVFNLIHLEISLREGFEVTMKIDKKMCEECWSSQRWCEFKESLPLEVKCVQLHHPQTGISSSAKIGSGAGVIMFIFLVLSLFLQILRRRKRKTSHGLSQQNVKAHNTQHDLKALIPLKQYSYAQVKRITNSFAEVVGKGGFGTVYRGNICDGRTVAVKVLKDTKGNNSEDFINEVASISQTSHVNIVTLLGFCSEGSKRAILYEFLENGSLDKFISSKRSSNMDLTTLYRIALGVARGLDYLHHGCRTRIVHFDIKPQNVLLDDNFCPKVSDFGLAKLCEREESILSLLDTRGTIGYIAPEVFSRVYGRVSHKSDVYSYGMLVLEMIGARNKPSTENSASNPSSMYFPEWIYRDLEKRDNGRIIENGISSEEEEEIVTKMTLVGLWCIQSWPTNRPPMNRVVEMMEGNLNALELPPRPVFQIPAAPLEESFTLSEDMSGYTEVCSMNIA